MTYPNQPYPPPQQSGAYAGQPPQNPYLQAAPPDAPAPFGNVAPWQAPGASPFGQRPPSRALLYVSAALFLVCAAVAAAISAMGVITTYHSTPDGGYRVPDFPEMAAALIGAAIAGADYGKPDLRYVLMSITIVFGSIALLFAITLFARVPAVRWILGVTGVLVSFYYIYAVIWLATNGGARYIAVPMISLLLWLSASILVMLPQVGQATRESVPIAHMLARLLEWSKVAISWVKAFVAVIQDKRRAAAAAKAAQAPGPFPAQQHPGTFPAPGGHKQGPGGYQQAPGAFPAPGGYPQAPGAFPNQPPAQPHGQAANPYLQQPPNTGHR